ncbi:hypothetical protein [Chondromyces apiculatus]|uniref:hypothetical protein n=1 Tax=Chondromyces apiculatus TaxID=51 RepID=UPI0012DEC2E5|nr:hypothetical protein [Chondromyces apiculatus]
MPRPCLVALALTALTSTAFLPSSLAKPTAAQTKRACATAYEETQSLRSDGKLQAARDKAVLCAADACPAVVRGDCTRWLQEIEDSQPTVVFHVTAPDGRETADVRLQIDGKLTHERLDGTALPIDPGEHLLRFEIPGADPIEQRHVIREGEKLRAISVSFAPEPPPSTASGPSSALPDDTTASRGTPGLVWVLGGIGIASLGVGATFGILGITQKSDLEDTCAPRCNDTDVSAVRTKLLAADIGVGVGVVSLGVATVLFLTSGPSAKTDARRPLPVDLALTPLTGGGYAGISGTF